MAEDSVIWTYKPGYPCATPYHTYILFPPCRYLGDGRFHLESVMIANPDVPAYRYGLGRAEHLWQGESLCPGALNRLFHILVH